jgi:hypothetical protein
MVAEPTRRFRMVSVRGPRVPKVLVQTWLTAEEYAAVERVCNEKQWSMAHLVRESVRQYAKEKEAA